TVTLNSTSAPTGSTAQSFCIVATVANLVATRSSIPSRRSSNLGSPLASTTVLVNNTHYYASQTVNGCESATRLDVTVTLNGTSTPTGSTAQSFCSGATVANLVATGSTIQWYAAASGGSPLASTTVLVNNTHYYASQTVNGCESATRLDVTVTINGTSAPTGSTAQSFCSGATVANLVATGSTIQWYAAASGGSPLASTTVLVNNTHYYASQTVNGCESATRLDVTVTINATSAPIGSAAQSFCSGATVANLVATGSTIQWYAAASGGSSLASTTVLVNNTHYYASQTVNGCESATRLDVTVTINATSAPIGSAAQSFCSGATVANLVATGSTIQCYAAASGGSPFTSTTVLVNNSRYYASQTVNGCESATRLDVTVTINGTSAPTGSTAQSFCSGATVAKIVRASCSVRGYAAASGGSLLASTTVLVNNTHYYASQTVNGCESATRLDVTVIING